MAKTPKTLENHEPKALVIHDVSNSANKKTVSKRHMYYHGDDCYVYETICGHCGKKIGGWTEAQADQKWNEHYC